MELLQDKISGVFSIRPDGHNAANPGVFFDSTDSIGYWVNNGLTLTDGKAVKAEVRRIVELNAGADVDAKFNALPNDEIKIIAGQELLFDLQKGTLTAALMTEDEYEAARLRRQVLSAQARDSRWQAMLIGLTDPNVLVGLGKLAFLAEELKKYKDDYVIADNKIYEAFINGTDHPLNAIVSYPRDVDFATTPANSLMGLPLWIDGALGGVDAPYKTLVTDTIIGCIIDASHYITT